MRCAALCLALLAAPTLAQDYSGLCATPANYQGGAMYGGGTCDQMMDHYTGSGNYLEGKDFSSAFSCSAEAATVRNIVNDVATNCCGTGNAASRRSACWVDHSYLCTTPANYQGGANGPLGTCDQSMDYYTRTGGLVGKDFSSAFSCSAETGAVKYTVNDIASYCCGTGGVSACWVDHSYLCADPSSWTPSTVITHDDGTTSTCMQTMDYLTAAGEPLEGDDFSSASTAAESCTKSPVPGHERREYVVHWLGATSKCCSSGDSVCSDIVDSATLGGRVASAVGAVSVFAVLLGFH